MLQASKRGFFRRTYDLSEDGQPLAELSKIKREGCAFTLAGTRYQIERERRKHFVFNGPREQVAAAERVRSREWTLRSAEGTFTLARPSIWRSKWELSIGGRSLGLIGQDGAFKRTSTANLAPEVPLALRVFAFYVVLMMWERDAATAAAAGAGAGAGT